MPNEVSDISKESIIQRVIRDNALAALMLVMAFVTMVNGIIIGVCIAVIINQGEKYDALRDQVAIDSTWKSRLIGILERDKIEVPETE